MGAPSPAPAGRLPMVLAVFGAMSMLLVISLMHMHRASHAMKLKHGQFEMLYNQWGTNDHNDHWGGVGSENYHTAKYDKSGSNANYHPRDSSSGDADAMEPAWWRSGPGANSEYTGHAMDGDLNDPPDVKIFKPFMMKQKGVRKTELYDIDGPSKSDAPRASWAASGEGTSDWMLTHEGPLLAQQQEGLQDARHPEADSTALQVTKAEARSLANWRKAHPANKHWVGVKATDKLHHAPVVRKAARGVHAPDSILGKLRAREVRLAKIKGQRDKVLAAKMAAAKARSHYDHDQDQRIIFGGVQPHGRVPQGAIKQARTQKKRLVPDAFSVAQDKLNDKRKQWAEKNAGHGDEVPSYIQEAAERRAYETAHLAPESRAQQHSRSRGASSSKQPPSKALRKESPAPKQVAGEAAAKMVRQEKLVAPSQGSSAETKISSGTQELHMQAPQKVPSWITDPWQPVRPDN